MSGAYGRAPRFKSVLRPATSPYLGPGAYFPYIGELCVRCVSNAPFLTTADARAPLTPREQRLLPAPNAYRPYMPYHVPGGEWSTGPQRVQEPEEEERPGPTSYSPRPPRCVHRDGLCGREGCPGGDKCTCLCWAGQLLKPPPGAGPCGGVSPPSIPSKGARGFRRPPPGCLADAGHWEPVRPDTPLLPPGPLTYDIGPPEHCQVTLKYKGVFWSLLRAPRGGKKRKGCCSGAGNPGPAYYDPYGPSPSALAPLQAEYAATRIKKTAEARLLRSADVALRETERQNYPSPCAYDVRSPPKEYTHCLRPPFLSTAKRFRRVRRTGPGPADTVDRRTALEVLLRPVNCRRPPFLTTAPRVTTWGGTCSPGPAAYDRAVCQCSCDIAGSELAPFGSRTPRALVADMGDPCHPGPALYSPRRPAHCRPRGRTAAFLSTTERMKTPKRKWLADVGTYEVGAASAALFGQCNHLCRRARLRCPFLRGSPRCSYKEPAPSPGPGDYETRVDSVANALLGSMGTTPLHKPPPDTPGPAHYHIHRLHADTVVWPTYNTTLWNPVLRPRPMPPAMPRARLVTMRKRLRCFLLGDPLQCCH